VLYNTTEYVLRQIASLEAHETYTEPQNRRMCLKSTVETLVIGFLNFVKGNDNMTEAIPYMNKNEKQTMYYLREFHKKTDLFLFFHEQFVEVCREDYEEFGGRTCSKVHFTTIWKNNFKDLKARDSRAPPCPTCLSFDQEIKNETPLAQDQLRKGRDKHLDLANLHIVSIDAKKGEISLFGSCNLNVGDYKAGVKFTYTFPLPAKLAMLNLPEYKIGGYVWYQARTVKKHYFVHPSFWQETANSIISSFYILLTDKPDYRGIQILNLAFDNHSTNKNYTVLCFFLWLIRYKRQLVEVNIYFYIEGHTKNVADQAHSAVEQPRNAKSQSVLSKIW
jgi:hypothetical protein